MSPQTGKIIAELGLRYRPSVQADLVAHAESLRLLAQDVADIPPSILELGARAWVNMKAFMPKASELRILSFDCDRVTRENAARHAKKDGAIEPYRDSQGRTFAEIGNERVRADCARLGEPYHPLWATDDYGKTVMVR